MKQITELTRFTSLREFLVQASAALLGTDIAVIHEYKELNPLHQNLLTIVMPNGLPVEVIELSDAGDYILKTAPLENNPFRKNLETLYLAWEQAIQNREDFAPNFFAICAEAVRNYFTKEKLSFPGVVLPQGIDPRIPTCGCTVKEHYITFELHPNKQCVVTAKAVFPEDSPTCDADLIEKDLKALIDNYIFPED